MSHVDDSNSGWIRQRWWTAAILAPIFIYSGCATAPEPEVTSEDLESVEERLQDVERTNGRLMVRVEEAERQVSRIQDRTESNRIALQRQNRAQRRGTQTASPRQQQGDVDDRPAPAPESNYRQDRHHQAYQADPTLEQRMQERGGTRIPLSDQQSGVETHRDTTSSPPGSQAAGSTATPSGQEQTSPAPDSDSQEGLVISNEELEARYGPSDSGGGPSPPPSADESTEAESDSSGSTHAPVTSERLPTTDELDYPPARESQSDDVPQIDPEIAAADEAPDENYADASHDELMELYQDSLAQYRGGQYADALKGFTTFLHADPRRDYLDNALYWIGECHYGLGDYETSVEHFQRILDELPQADKVPDAKLKMSLAYDRLGQPDEAVQLLETLVERYPNTNPARLGEEQLKEYSR